MFCRGAEARKGKAYLAETQLDTLCQLTSLSLPAVVPNRTVDLPQKELSRVGF